MVQKRSNVHVYFHWKLEVLNRWLYLACDWSLQKAEFEHLTLTRVVRVVLARLNFLLQEISRG